MGEEDPSVRDDASSSFTSLKLMYSRAERWISRGIGSILDIGNILFIFWLPASSSHLLKTSFIIIPPMSLPKDKQQSH
jgi:hypothetical protein